MLIMLYSAAIGVAQVTAVTSRDRRWLGGAAVGAEEFDNSRAATSRLQTHRNEWNRWDSDCGGRNILWGTQEGHCPGAMWWLRRFYTVAFVCLFRLGSLPGGARGQPSVVIYLISSFTTLSLLSLIPIFIYFLLLLSQKSVVVIVSDGSCWRRFSLLSINPQSNRLWLLDFLLHSFCVLVCDWTETITHPAGEDNGVNGRIRHEQTSSHKCLWRASCLWCARLQHWHAELHLMCLH